MNAPNRQVLDTLLRNDLLAFTQRCFQTVVPGEVFRSNWHIEAIVYHLMRVYSGEVRRLLITLPPRSMKSICVSVAFTAWVLGHDPTRRIICPSHSRDLAGLLSRQFRAVIESPFYKRIFPRMRIDPRKDIELEMDTTARGFRFATSVNGPLTGRGGNLIIIDDPLKSIDAMSDVRRSAVNEWPDSTLLSRLDQKAEDPIILVMQRLHVDDLAGHVLANDDSWVHLKLPAIAEETEEIRIGKGTYTRKRGEALHPAREPLSVLEELRVTMGTSVFSAQYQQTPIPPEGALIRLDWFPRYASAPERRSEDRIIQSWDTASKVGGQNDYSVCTTWLDRNGIFYLLHVLRERLEYPDLKRRIREHSQRFNADSVLIEDAGAGLGLNQEFGREGGVRAIAIKPEGDKKLRLELQTSAIEARQVRIPESAPWLSEFLNEVLAFPGGHHDDQVDSLSQFLTWARKPRPQFHFEVISW